MDSSIIFPFFPRMLSDAKAVRMFYTDHHSHERERNMTCLGSVFEDILGSSMVTSHGRDEIRRCRGPFEKYFSTQAVSDSLKVIERECVSFVETLTVGKAVDLDERTLGNLTLRILVHKIYGKDVLEKYFGRILGIFDMLQDTLEMDNLGVTRLPFYSYLPTKTKWKARSFNTAWYGFNRFLFKEYEEGRLSSREGWFFSIVESIKTHQLELDEEEVC
jgi:cytochrome P450